MDLPRLAVICDYAEEGWPSMDLSAEMLLRELWQRHAGQCRALRIGPPFRRRAMHLPFLGRRPLGTNLDRLLNRFWDYPRHLRRRKQEFDLFHLVDHSYSQLVRVLPAHRTGVFCHDLDTFRCLLEPERERRPRWFKALVRRTLDGFQRAAVVFHTTAAVRQEIERHGLVEPARLVQAPLGAAPEFTPEAMDPDPAAKLLAPLNGAPFVLHVGSCIPRKRMDVLLEVFAAVRKGCPGLRLVKVGGPWTPEQRLRLERLSVATAVTQLVNVERTVLASLYRRAALVLLPSEAEGFGIPVLEALACGALVVASDLPSLREVGGEAAVYCPVGDLSAWSGTAGRLLVDSASAPTREVRLLRAGAFSWSAHARIILEAYQRLLM